MILIYKKGLLTGISDIPPFNRSTQNQERRAIIAPKGIFTYKKLMDASGKIASCLPDGAEDLQEMRIAFLTPPGFQHMAIQWGIWRCKGLLTVNLLPENLLIAR